MTKKTAENQVVEEKEGFVDGEGYPNCEGEKLSYQIPPGDVNPKLFSSGGFLYFIQLHFRYFVQFSLLKNPFHRGNIQSERVIPMYR